MQGAACSCVVPVQKLPQAGLLKTSLRRPTGTAAFGVGGLADRSVRMRKRCSWMLTVFCRGKLEKVNQNVPSGTHRVQVQKKQVA